VLILYHNLTIKSSQHVAHPILVFVQKTSSPSEAKTLDIKPTIPYYCQGNMKKDIHPQYYPKAKIICSCGKIHEIGSTREKMEVEICSACHPFFTGQEKLIDTAGRVEKFRSRRARAEAHKTAKRVPPKKPASAGRTTRAPRKKTSK